MLCGWAARTLRGCLLWMESAGRSERGATGGACLRPWALVEPRHNVIDIDGGGDRDVLHVGLRQAPISGPAEAKSANPLGERPFDTSPPLIALLALLTGRPGLRRCQCLVLVLGREPQPSPPVLGTGTAGPHRTRPTRMLVKFHNDRATALPAAVLPPRSRHVALGAADLLLVKVYLKLLYGVSSLDLHLPSLAGARRTPQDDALVVPAVDEELRADRGRIDQMLARGQVFLDERVLDGLCALRFMDARGRRVHMGEEVGHGGLAGFADMHHVAGPRRVAFVAVARLDIIGRFDPFRGRGQRALGLEVDTGDGRVALGGRLTRGPLVVALSGLPERGNHG